MPEIKYKTLSGKEFEVSGDFKCFGMKALWSAFESCKNPVQAKLLEEAHAIMSGVLHGTITKTDKNENMIVELTATKNGPNTYDVFNQFGVLLGNYGTQNPGFALRECRKRCESMGWRVAS